MSIEDNKPLDFIVVGSGQVVDKYWLRSAKDGSVNIPSIVSLEPEVAFRQRNSSFRGSYYQTTSVESTLERVSSLVLGQELPNIALATPAETRLALITGILSDSDSARLFIEKPYASSQYDLDSFEDLLTRYSPRMHLSGKYAQGRADILYPYLPEGIAPRTIAARLIEGTDYFKVVRDKVASEGSHQYLIDGPELDLGFHLLDIIATSSQRFGGIESLRAIDVFDLSQKRSDFEPHYGVGANLEIVNSRGEKIFLNLQAGKADVANERFVEFDYGDSIIGQEYTVGDAIDPVYILRVGSTEKVDQHPTGYNYYARELLPIAFCQQRPTQQAFSLSMTRACLEIKNRRVSSTVY